MNRLLLILIGLTLWLPLSQGASLSKANLDQLVNDYLTLKPSELIPSGLTLSQARQTQSRFVKRLEKNLGKPVGYKIALVTRASQEKFQVTHPVRGVLLSKMLLDNGSVLPARYGVNPLCEADLLVSVGSRKINRARTPLEALKHLHEIIAFIELPDLWLATNQPIDGAALTAINAGARFGIMGGRTEVRPTHEFFQAFANMSIIMTDRDQKVLGQAQAKEILDNPLHAVLWLVEDLNRQGIKLKKGDYLSLGGLVQIPPASGQTIRVTYRGLPRGPIRAVVSFQ